MIRKHYSGCRKSWSKYNPVRLSFVRETVPCSTLEPPHPRPLSPKGARGAVIWIFTLAPVGESMALI